jgi:cytochrome b6-f complex iron-sulfur subunit
MTPAHQPGRSTESTRRRFLVTIGTSSLITAATGFVVATARFLFPNVLYEPPTRFPVGQPEDFAPDSVTFLADRQLFVFKSPSGFHAISSVCTHLGCTVRHLGREGFSCPCHGSLFDIDGHVTRGPATRPLSWFGLTLSPRRELVVDEGRRMDPTYRFQV